VRVLVLNTGSSSVKYQLIETATEERLAGGIVEEVTDHAEALDAIGEELADTAVDAVGHRVVHGGERFSEPALVDDTVVEAVRDLVPLAPLHNPANLLGIEQARRRWPAAPHVAVFDTAFHRTLPPAAHRYAVPESWYTDLGVRRYGFHGTSHQYVARRAAEPGHLGRLRQADDDRGGKAGHPVQVLNEARGEIRDQYLSSNKAARLLGWQPDYGLDEALSETVDYYARLLQER
jgi:acetate kinase